MSSQTNSFLEGPLGPIYARTAFPIVFVTLTGLVPPREARAPSLRWGLFTTAVEVRP